MDELTIALYLKEMKSMLDAADKEGRDLTDEEMKRYNFYDKELKEENEKPYKPDFKAVSGAASGIENSLMLQAGQKTWTQLFNKTPKKADISLAEFVQRVCQNNIDDRMQMLQSITDTMSESTGIEGGFSVPEQWYREIFDSTFEVSVVMPYVTVLPMTTNILNVPGWNSADQTKGNVAEIEMQFLSEKQAASRVTPKLTTVAYNAVKAAVYLAASSEALMDSAAIGLSIPRLMRNAIGFGIDKAVLIGTGIKQPLGVINAPATILYPRAVAAGIAFADITGMFGRMLPSSLKRCVWVASPDAFATMLPIETSAGSGQLILQGDPSPAKGLPMTLFGRPFLISEKLGALGDKGDLMLCDFEYYGLGTRESARFEKTNSAQWLEDIQDMRLIMRVDGKPLIHLPYTPSGGGSTVSPFVILDA